MVTSPNEWKILKWDEISQTNKIQIILFNNQTGTTARFDFEGKLVTSDEGIDVKMGLHHHGNEPEVSIHKQNWKWHEDFSFACGCLAIEDLFWFFFVIACKQRAGYSLEELFHLCRSTNNQQRMLALKTLANVLTKVRQ